MKKILNITFIVLLILKQYGINISWFLVFMPLWVVPVLGVFFLVLFKIILLIVDLIEKLKGN